jgi:hypothetical protein
MQGNRMWQKMRKVRKKTLKHVLGSIPFRRDPVIPEPNSACHCASAMLVRRVLGLDRTSHVFRQPLYKPRDVVCTLRIEIVVMRHVVSASSTGTSESTRAFA